MKEELLHLLTLGRDHYNAGDYDEAEDLLCRVAAEHGGFADVFNMLGVIYYSTGRYGDAEQAFEKALTINPNYTEAALNLSVTYNDRGKYEKARTVYHRILEHAETQDRGLDPYARGKLANMHAELGEAYASTGLYEEAVEQYRSALELCPNFIDLRTRLGNVLRDNADPDSAIAEYLRVKEEKPEFIPARVALGVTYYSLGRREDALSEWNDALALDPDNKSASLYLRMVSSDSQAPEPGSALAGSDDDS